MRLKKRGGKVTIVCIKNGKRETTYERGKTMRTRRKLVYEKPVRKRKLKCAMQALSL